MRIKLVPKFVLTLLVFSCLAAVPAFTPARAQDERDTYVRMYTEDNKLVAPPPQGSTTVPAHRSVSNSNDVPSAPIAAHDTTPAAPAPASSTPTPTRANAVPPPPGQHRATMSSNTSGGSLDKVESFGTLTDAKTGGLGTDMWDGSSRAAVTGLIENLPDAASFRIAAQLTRRALLTAADSSLLTDNDTPAPGQDLLTLRLRKLMAMGALDDAAALYKENPLPPHDAAMAEAGIEALLADAQPALACLETKALDGRFAGDASWAPLNAFCDFYVGQLSGHGGAVNGGDAIVRQMASSAAYRFHAGDLRDLDRLPALDRLMLAADHRVEYGAANSATSLSPLTLALVEHDTAAPLTLRFNLLIAGARSGIFDRDDIATFYKDIPFGNLAQTDAQATAGREAGWQRIAWLYKSGDTQHGLIDKTVLQTALPLRGAYGDIALWPFAPLLQNVDPAGLGADVIRSGVMIALQTGDSIPQNWAAAWKSSDFGRAGSPGMRLAFALGTDGNLDDSLIQNSGLSKESTELLSIAINALDNGKKLHNINGAEVYGNVNSVPALVDLDAAENDHRLGEAVLLASAALDRQSPATLSPTVFREVLSGYRLTGLNKEARALAIEVALGIK